VITPADDAIGSQPRTTSEVAGTRADVPGGRVHRGATLASTPRTKGGIHMAKKAKGGKKKAAKKR